MLINRCATCNKASVAQFTANSCPVLLKPTMTYAKETLMTTTLTQNIPAEQDTAFEPLDMALPAPLPSLPVSPRGELVFVAPPAESFVPDIPAWLPETTFPNAASLRRRRARLGERVFHWSVCGLMFLSTGLPCTDWSGWASKLPNFHAIKRCRLVRAAFFCRRAGDTAGQG